MFINLFNKQRREELILPIALKLTGSQIINYKQLSNNFEHYSTLFFGSEEYVTVDEPNSIGEIPQGIKMSSATYSISKPFVSEIENAQLIGSRAVGLDEKGNIIAETTLPPVGNLSPRFQGGISIHNLLTKNLPELKKTYRLDTACSLVNYWSKAYYHWFLDSLTRLEGLEVYQQKTGRKPVVIIDSNPHIWQIESLKLLGYSLDECIQWNQEKTTLEKLIVPAYRQPGNWVSPSALFWLRQRIFSNISISSQQHSFSRRIYISRSLASGRRVINENEIINILRPYGFVKYNLERMTFLEQLELFSFAEIIIGPHGAGFTNIIFSQTKPTIIELVTPWISPHYYFISKILDFPYWCFECFQPYVQKIRRSKGDMVVNVTSFKNLIKQLKL